jgi:hypothetical protein
LSLEGNDSFLHVPEPKPIPSQNPRSKRHSYAWLFPQRIANLLAFNASSLPTTRTRVTPCSSVRTSFTRIRNNVIVSRPLRTLSTHRMVKSNKPLSTRSRTLNQTRFLNARIFSRASFRPVSGESRIPCRSDSSVHDLENQPLARRSSSSRPGSSAL